MDHEQVAKNNFDCVCGSNYRKHDLSLWRFCIVTSPITNDMRISNGKVELIYPELSYKLVGILFSVSNQLGYGHRESTIETAVRQLLKDANISFREQQSNKLIVNNKPVKTYRVDFIIENCLILELKSKDHFDREDIAQVYDYLRTHNLKLGIIANFTKRGVKFKRIIHKTN